MLVEIPIAFGNGAFAAFEHLLQPESSLTFHGVSKLHMQANRRRFRTSMIANASWMQLMHLNLHPIIGAVLLAHLPTNGWFVHVQSHSCFTCHELRQGRRSCQLLRIQCGVVLSTDSCQSG